MELQEIRGAGPHIEAYESGLGFRIGDTWHPNSILLRAGKPPVCKWSCATLEAITEYDIQQLMAEAPALLLLGTGSSGDFLANELLMLLYRQKIPFEIMNTRAACRTYNLLMSEGRDVLAALIYDDVKS